MHSDRAVARLAPRSAWQAIDMGGALYRAWWRPLLVIWLAFTLPAALLLALVFSSNLFLASLIFWWLKPLWERPLLEFQARAMFGEQPSLGTLLREAPGYLFNGLLASLTWRRFSPARSFNLPAWQLERQKGSALSQRLRLLHLPPSQRPGLLTILMLHIEQAVAFGLLTALYLLLPWQFNLEFASWVENSGESWLMLLCWYLALCITEPLYVACGFSLYLNRRTVLEGWDMETGLRAIARRRRAGVGGIAATILLIPLFLLPVASDAADGKALQQEAIEIVAGDDFMPMEVRNRITLRDSEGEPRRGLLERFIEWLLRRESSEREWQPGFGDQLVTGLRLLMWLLAGLALAWLFYQAATRLLPELRNSRTRRNAPWQPEILRQPLPDDIPGAVHQALTDNDIRRAISLLYRGTLVRLAERHQLRFPPGATEQECLSIARAQAADQAAFLTALANHWMATAWAHRPPSRQQGEALLADWRRHFAAPAEASEALS